MLFLDKKKHLSNFCVVIMLPNYLFRKQDSRIFQKFYMANILIQRNRSLSLKGKVFSSVRCYTIIVRFDKQIWYDDRVAFNAQFFTMHTECLIMCIEPDLNAKFNASNSILSLILKN